MLKRIREASPSFKARIAGVLFLLVILTAAFTEFFVRGRLGFAADIVVGLVEVSGMIAVTLLFYDIFRAVNRSLFARGVLQFRGTYLRASSMESSGHGHRHWISRTLLPPDGLPPLPVNLPASNSGRADGVCRSVLAGLPVTDAHTHLSPYNLALGLLGEGSVPLWLLVMSVNVQRWKEQAST